MSDLATVRRYMTTRIVTFTPDMDLHEAIRLLLRHKISGVPVLDAGGALVGVLSKRDCLKIAFSASYHQERAGPVSAYMSRTCRPSMPTRASSRSPSSSSVAPSDDSPSSNGDDSSAFISRHDVLRALEELW